MISSYEKSLMCVMRFMLLCYFYRVPNNAKGDLPWYLECAFERDKAGRVVFCAYHSERSQNMSQEGMESIQYIGSRHPNRQVLVLGRKRDRCVISRFEQRLEV